MLVPGLSANPLNNTGVDVVLVIVRVVFPTPGTVKSISLAFSVIVTLLLDDFIFLNCKSFVILDLNISAPVPKLLAVSVSLIVMSLVFCTTLRAPLTLIFLNSCSLLTFFCLYTSTPAPILIKTLL